MKFTSTILDNENNEWNFEAEVEGRGMYDEDGDKSEFVIEGFKLTNIVLSCKGGKMSLPSMAVVPDCFAQRDLNDLEKEAKEQFIEEWMDFQEDVYDASSIP